MSAGDTPVKTRTLRTLAAVLLLSVAACGTAHAEPEPEPPPAPTDNDPSLDIGSSATDTVGGWLPDGVTLSPFDDTNPIVLWLDPALRKAIQDAAHKAATEGVDIQINSGWRSKGFQQRLFDDAVRMYRSADIAREFVASPETSMHVEGRAVDIAPVEADRWLIANGAQFGLCQIFANEIWHFELAVDDQGRCPPLLPNAAG